MRLSSRSPRWTSCLAAMLALPACGAPRREAPAPEEIAMGAEAPGGCQGAERAAVAFTPLSLALPASSLRQEARRVFTSAAELRGALGVEAPQIDWSTTWVALYAAGERSGGGYQAAITGLRLADCGAALELTTSLEAPGEWCGAGAGPSQPYALVSFARPASAPLALRSQGSERTRSCFPPDPSSCTGTVSEDNRANVFPALPRLTWEDIPADSTYGHYAGIGARLAELRATRWVRSCAPEGACSPWEPRAEPVPFKLQGIVAAMVSPRNLAFFGKEWFVSGSSVPMHYIQGEAEFGSPSFQMGIAEHWVGRGRLAVELDAPQTLLERMSGTLSDRCVRLVSEYRLNGAEYLTVLSGEW